MRTTVNPRTHTNEKGSRPYFVPAHYGTWDQCTLEDCGDRFCGSFDWLLHLQCRQGFDARIEMIWMKTLRGKIAAALWPLRETHEDQPEIGVRRRREPSHSIPFSTLSSEFPVWG